MTKLNVSFVDDRLKVEAVLENLQDMRRLEELLAAAKEFLSEVPDRPFRVNSPEHESLRAVGRCLFARFGVYEGRRRLEQAVYALGGKVISDLTAEQARSCRKEIEELLPACAA